MRRSDAGADRRVGQRVHRPARPSIAAEETFGSVAVAGVGASGPPPALAWTDLYEGGVGPETGVRASGSREGPWRRDDRPRTSPGRAEDGRLCQDRREAREVVDDRWRWSLGWN